MLADSAESKQLKTIVDVRELQNEYVTLDKRRLQQIIIHLYSNAIKFTHEGKVKLKATIQPSLFPDVHSVQSSFDYLKIEVSDTGIGIGEDE